MAYFSDKKFFDDHSALFPELEALLSKAKSGYGRSFWDFSELFGEFFQSDFAIKFLKMEVGKINQAPDYDSLANDTRIEIVATPDFKLTISRLFRASIWEKERQELTCYANDFMYCNLGPGALAIEIYETPASQLNHVFDRAQKPHLTQTRLQQTGEVVSVRAGKDILRLKAGSEDQYQMYFLSNAVHPLVWHYDASTLEPKYCTAANPTSSKVQTALGILARIGSSSSIPRIRDVFYESTDHFVRWSAVRAMLALDEQQGKTILELAKNDTHPHVRAAARKTLAMLETGLFSIENSSRGIATLRLMDRGTTPQWP